MASLIHIAEIAAILAVAYMLGWTLGYVAHRLMAPKPAAVAAIPEARLAAATGGDALVKAPVIAPVADPAIEPPIAVPVPIELAVPVNVIEPATEPSAPEAPVPEAPVPSPAPVEAMPAVAEAVPVAEPVPPAAEPAAPPAEEAVEPATTPVARSVRRFRPAPKPAPEQVVADAVPASFTATPASQPGVAWTGEIKGRSATPVAAPEPAVAPTAADIVPAPATPIVEEIAAPQADPPAPLDATAELAPALAEAAPIPEPALSSAVEPQPAPPSPVYDEDAAMRAIEGGWSRVGARAMTDTPELSDMGAAVAAATTAVEQVLAKAGIDVDTAARGVRPKGLARPRNGAKDDLKQIGGLGALDESTLNNLGVYHFDQIADWNDAQVLWMENHVFARGRIGREEWQRQARALAASNAA